MNNRLTIFSEISKERLRQEDAAERHRDIGWCSMADPATLTEYRLAVLGEEFGEVCKELNEMRVGNAEATLDRLRKELIEVAAVAVAWVEGIDAGWAP